MKTESKGPSFFELARQALSSTRRGYDLLAPKFEYTDYATPLEWIEESLELVEQRYPVPAFERRLGADIACGTGRGARALRTYCRRVEGFDFSPGMLAQAKRLSEGTEGLHWVEADLAELELPEGRYDRIVSFGAWGHVLPSFRERLLAQILAALRPGGVFVTLTADDPPIWQRRFWFRVFFDFAIKLRNLVWFDQFHMYYGLNSTESLLDQLRETSWHKGGYEIGLERLRDEEASVLTLLTVRRAPAD